MAIRYVSGNADPGGNGTTPNLSSGDGTHAYDSQSACIIGEAGPLTEPLDVLVLDSLEDDRPDWDGFSGIDQFNFITIGTANPSDGHQGVFGAGYIIQNTGGNTIDTYEPYTVFEGWTIRSGSPDWSALVTRAGADHCVARRMIFEGYASQGNAYRQSSSIDETDNFYMESCLLINCLNSRGALQLDRSKISNYKNLTIAKSSAGVTATSGAPKRTFHNTVAYGSTVGNDWTPNVSRLDQSTYCASGDGTAPAQTGTVVSDTISDVDFVDPANNDYNLAPGSVLIDGGNASEMATFDISGQPFITNDVGCYRYVPATGGHTVNLPGLQFDADPGVPQIDAPIDQLINLPGLQFDTDPGVPIVEIPDVGEDHTVNLPGLQFDTTPGVPAIDVPIDQTIILAQAVNFQLDPSAPTVNAPVDNIVELPRLRFDNDPGVPPVMAGTDQIVTLGNALDINADPGVPEVIGQLTHYVNLPAANFTANPAVPTVEGESDLPPQILTPTSDQVYTFGAGGTVPAPEHFLGTGENPQWSFVVEDFSTQPGVLQWTIDVNTGTITYSIKALSTDANEQALNTKGPYTTTRRITTTVGNDDETFKIFVNVGNKTLQMTPGTPCATWSTATAAAQGVEVGFDPSARVTQTYTVT